MRDIVLADFVKKKKLDSSSQKENSGKRKRKDGDIDDDTKLAVLKDQVMRQIAARKSIVDKFIPEVCRTGVVVKNVKVEVVAGLKSTSAYMDMYSGAKKIKSGGMIKDHKAEKKKLGSSSQKENIGKRKQKVIDMDDDTKLAALKDQVMRQVAATKSLADKSVLEMCRPGVGIQDVKVEIVAGLKSASTYKAVYSASKKIKSGDMIKYDEGEDVTMSKILKDNEMDVKFSTKWKKGADAEIIQAYLSSPENNLSRFRPRKVVPSFRMVELGKNDNYRIVGKRIKVYWPESRRWFTGRIQAFDRRKKIHSILYEDGDKEELDLTKERFELEIIPSESFNLRVEPNYQKKVGAFDVIEINADTSKQESAKVGDAENVSESSLTEKNRASEKTNKRGSAELEIKGIEVQMGEGLVTGIDVDLKYKTFNDQVSGELLVAKEPDEVISEKERDDSKTAAEMSNKAIIALEAQTGGSTLLPLAKTIGLEEGDGDYKKSEETVKDDSDKKGTTELVKANASSRRKTTSSAGKRRKKNLVSRKVSKKKDKLEVEVGPDVCHDEVKMNSVHDDNQHEESAKDDHQMENDKTSEENKDEDGVSLGACGITVYQDISSLDAVKSSEVDRQIKMEIASKDTVNVASNVEIAVLTLRRVEENVKRREINVETPCDVISEKDDGVIKCQPKIVSDMFTKLLTGSQPTNQKNPEETSFKNLLGKLNQEQGESHIKKR